MLFSTGSFSVASLLAMVQVFNPSGVAGWAIVLIGGAGTIYGARAYGRQRAGEVWKETAEGWKSRAELAEKGRDEQRALKHAARNELAAERMKTDLSVVVTALQAVMSTQNRQTDLLEKLVERLLRSE